MGELDIGTADDLNGFDNPVRIILKPLLKIWRDGQHGGSAKAVAGMNAHGIHILDKADGNHLIFGIPNHFQLQLFPAKNRFLHQNLMNPAGGKASRRNDLKLFDVVNQTAAGSTHSISWPDHHRIAKFLGCFFRILNRINRLAAGHLDAQTIHGFLERCSILAPLDGIDIDPDDLDPVFGENSAGKKLGGQIQRRLSAQVG